MQGIAIPGTGNGITWESHSEREGTAAGADETAGLMETNGVMMETNGVVMETNGVVMETNGTE
jgi:hypothetical protein